MPWPSKRKVPGAKKRPFYRSLFFQIAAGLVLGAVVGAVWPDFGAALKPLGDGFVKLVKMIIAPLVFCVVVIGIAGAGDLATLRRIGVKALIYFEIVSTAALVVGLVITEIIGPGQGFNVDPSTLDPGSVQEKTEGAPASASEFVLDIIPESVIGAFAENSLLQVLLFSVLFGIAMIHAGERARPLMSLIEKLQDIIFTIVAWVMKLAPIATFGVMAYTVGEYGLGSLTSFGKMIGAFYLAILVFLVLLAVLLRVTTGVGFLRVVNYVREELVTAAFTGSSEAVLPQITKKLEDAGCSRTVVGLVVPTGYSFNLDGASIYISASVVFLAQAMGTDLGFSELLTIILVAVLTSKGMAGVAGSAFVALTATIGAVGGIPAAAAVLILGPDRIMAKGRTATNLIGNVVATLIVARWEKQLDRRQLDRALRRGKSKQDSEEDISEASRSAGGK
ncbi:C4-dicarboxylate transporter DctA [Saccharopolyspora sp. NPDC002686]|uniref:C4-dicarboxylate transporter DctA n=1 Tax=Saccharopolyspora sp. NPDC002686 TaxID=3154541 RepID=UPI0033309F0D